MPVKSAKDDLIADCTTSGVKLAGVSSRQCGDFNTGFCMEQEKLLPSW